MRSIPVREASRASMLSPRGKELLGILLCGTGLLMGLSLLSYHPEDPSWNVAGSHLEVHNLVGRFGALLSDLLFMGLGGGAWLLPLLALFTGVRALRGRAFPGSLAFLGGLGVLLSGAPLLNLYEIRLQPGPVGAIPPGGLLGDAVAAFLLPIFAQVGTTLILGTGFLLSLVLLTGISPRESGLGLLRGLESGGRGILWGIQILGRIPLPRIRLPRGRSRTTTQDRASTPTPVPRPRIQAPAPPEPTPLQEPLSFLLEGEGATLPPLGLLTPPPQTTPRIQREDLQARAQMLAMKLRDFGIQGEVVQVHPGPVVTLYEFQPAPGVKLQQIRSLSTDLALAMKSGSVRIEAPIPGKSTVGIEIPNLRRREVRLKEILASEVFTTARSLLTLALGVDIHGQPVVVDLARLPHLLVAGATGSGKSVALNAMITSLLYRARPELLRMILIDPKMIELTPYEGIPHLLCPVVTRAREAPRVLKRVILEMERRYQILSEMGCRSIDAYHRRWQAQSVPPGGAGEEGPSPLPWIVVVIDELADLMLVAGREVEDALCRLAQMARAAGIHLIVATQRPSVDVLTGVIKANFPARISFQVTSRADSRTILDATGAEELLGRGDMLYLAPGTARLQRIHGPLIEEEEVHRVVQFLRRQGPPAYDPAFLESERDPGEEMDPEEDAHYQQAKELVLSSGQASISFLQRRLRIGFNRAARIIERLEAEGIVGPATGGRREVLQRRREG